MYVTLEPCPMCAGAIIQARVPRVIMGARNQKAGCCGSVVNMLQQPGLNHQAEQKDGILLEECQALLAMFFQKLRR